MECECGFRFAGPGEIRNCEAFITASGDSGVICPECGAAYLMDGRGGRVESEQEETAATAGRSSSREGVVR